MFAFNKQKMESYSPMRNTHIHIYKNTGRIYTKSKCKLPLGNINVGTSFFKNLKSNMNYFYNH